MKHGIITTVDNVEKSSVQPIYSIFPYSVWYFLWDWWCAECKYAGWNYLSIPKLQWLRRWIAEMDK